jgi:hypothetical protein
LYDEIKVTPFQPILGNHISIQKSKSDSLIGIFFDP